MLALHQCQEVLAWDGMAWARRGWVCVSLYVYVCLCLCLCLCLCGSVELQQNYKRCLTHKLCIYAFEQENPITGDG